MANQGVWAESLRAATWKWTVVVVVLGLGFPQVFGPGVFVDVVFGQHWDEDEVYVKEKIEVSQRSELVVRRQE